MAHESGEHSTHPVVDWCNFCRDVCEEHLIQNPVEVGGFDQTGNSNIVEDDESLFYHRNYHRGHWRPERGNDRCFMVEVPDREAETLLAIIESLCNDELLLVYLLSTIIYHYSLYSLYSFMYLLKYLLY